MKETITRTVEGLDVRAMFKPTSLNDDARTIDVVFATGTPVRTFNWEDGQIEEILSFETGHVRMERLLNGAPVLDNHNRNDGTESVLGVVESASIVEGEGIATLRFSKREEVQGVYQDIKDGILRGISVGYRVYKYEVTKEEGKLPVYRAIDWEPYEISIAPVQADINSQTRSISIEPIQEKQKPTNIKMTNEEKTASDLAIADNQRKEKALQEAAIVGERNRVNDINDVVRKANLKSDFAEKLIKDGTSIDAARALVIDEIAKATETSIASANATATVGVEAKDKMRKGMEDALEHRANPTIALTDIGREFRGLSMIDLARTCAIESGVNVKGLSQREVALEALGLSKRGYMSSSDFPLVLSNVVNKTLRRQYEFQSPTFQAFCQRGTFKDFKSKSIVQLGDVTKMKQILEGGEYKYGTMGETAESYKANKYGMIIPLTWEAIVNDDLSAFSRIPNSISTKARQLQSDIVYAILSANAALSDGVALFHATHNNYTGTGTAISVAALQVGRVALRNQKDAQGDALNLVPKYLLVGPAKEQEAYQFTSSNYTPTKGSDINPVYNTALQVIVDARITGNEWYLIADPSMIDTIEYSFLEGEGELFTEQKIGWEVDGMELKARMVFNAKAIDYRGMYKNAGA